MQVTIRRYQARDEEMVQSLFSRGIEEHVWPSFTKAMSGPLYLVLTLGLGVAGYLLASGPGALALVSGWVGLVYYCCYKVYVDFVRQRLQMDMRDIVGCYMSQPNNCFWVAEASGDGKDRVVGMVAVVAKENGAERYGELFRMCISPAMRRMGLGYRMTQTVVDFCKQRGMSKVVLDTTSSQTAGVALYQKMGFKYVRSYTKTHLPDWMMKINRITIVVMEKCI